MAWPLSRLTTYVAAAPVKSNDLNALQDAIIAASHGEVPVQFPMHGFVNTGFTLNGNGHLVGAGGAQMQFIHVPGIRAGDIITEFALDCDRGGAGTVGAFIYTMLRGTPTTRSTVSVAAGTGWNLVVGTPSGLPHTMVAGEVLMAEATATNAANLIASGRVKLYRP